MTVNIRSEKGFALTYEEMDDNFKILRDLVYSTIPANTGGIPTVTYANMMWYDTAANILYMRNEENDAWIVIGTLNQSTNTFTPAGSLTLASQAEAEAGTDNTKVMTPLRVKQHLLANIRSVNAGVNVGEIGTYAMLIQTSKTNRAAGAVIAGSGLRYFATEARTGNFVNHRHYAGDTAPTGSWKMMGQVFHLYGEGDARAATLFLRIS